MINSNYFKLFVLGFFLCFLAEGVGIVPKSVTFPLFLSFFLLLCIVSLKLRKDFPIYNPWIFIGVFCYLLYLFYISSFSLNRQVSFELVVFLFSLFLLFINVAKKWEVIEKPFLYSLLVLGVVFCVYSFLLSFVLSNNLFYFYPKSGYQYVYSLFGSHNHLGDFLVFPLIISFYLYTQKKKKILLGLFFFYLLFFLFSYSRAAYIGFLIGFVLLCINYRHKFLRKQEKIVGGLVIGVIFFFFLISSNVLQGNNFRFISEKMHIIPNQKSVIGTREEYILQGLEGFLVYRFYGAGLSNFEYISKMFTERSSGWAASSHNIFMDVLVETGTLSLVVFVIFAVLLLRAIKKNHVSIFAVLLLSWFAIVQFDYIHRMYSYLLLFPLFLVGLMNFNKICHSERSEESRVETRSFGIKPQDDNNYLAFIIMAILSIFLVVYITSGILLKQGKYKLSRVIYPLQMQAYTYDLDQKEVLDTYVDLFPGEYIGWYKLGRIYQKEGDMPKAIRSYEKAFWLDPFRDLPMAENIYNMKIRYQSEKEGKRFADKLFTKLNNDTDETVLDYSYWLFINKFCQRVYNLHCAYTLQ